MRPISLAVWSAIEIRCEYNNCSAKHELWDISKASGGLLRTYVDGDLEVKEPYAKEKADDNAN